MYQIPYFKEENQSLVLDFIKNNPFAILTGSFLSGEQSATQIPLLLKEKNGKMVLQGHIMRHTNHFQAFADNPKVLALFTGPHAYVSATWYTNPYTPSTWNYATVHVSGTLHWLEEAELIALLQETSLHFENGNETSSTYYNQLPSKEVTAMLRTIVAFEIEIERIENVFKLSQNRDVKSYENIIHQLEQKGGLDALVAQQMKERQDRVFPHQEDTID